MVLAAVPAPPPKAMRSSSSPAAPRTTTFKQQVEVEVEDPPEAEAEPGGGGLGGFESLDGSAAAPAEEGPMAQVRLLLEAHQARLEVKMDGWLQRQEALLRAGDRGSRTCDVPTVVPRTSLYIKRGNTMAEPAVDSDNVHNYMTGKTFGTYVSSMFTTSPGGCLAEGNVTNTGSLMGATTTLLTVRKSRAESGDSEGLKGRVTPMNNKTTSRRRSVTTRGPCRTWVNDLVNHHRFEMFFAAMILSNGILIGIDVDLSTQYNFQHEAPPVLYMLSHVYNFIFLVEWVMRLSAAGWYKYVCGEQKWWNLLDTVVLASSLFETGIDIALLGDQYGKSSISQVSNLRVLRIIRLNRLVRVFRIGRLMRFFCGLRTMIYSIVCTLRSLVWAMILLIVLIYTFAVMFTLGSLDPAMTQADGSVNPSIRRWWGSVLRSMLSLFGAIAGGISWEELYQSLQLVKFKEFFSFIFIIYIGFTYFAVLNVVTAVFCESAIKAAKNDQDLMVQLVQENKAEYATKVKKLFTELDTDESGAISYDEFVERWCDEKVQNFFMALDLDAADAWDFFNLLDAQGAGTVDLEEFIAGCFHLRGPARGIDIKKIISESRDMVAILKQLLERVDRQEDRMIGLQQTTGGLRTNTGATQIRTAKSKPALSVTGSGTERTVVGNASTSDGTHSMAGGPAKKIRPSKVVRVEATSRSSSSSGFRRFSPFRRGRSSSHQPATALRAAAGARPSAVHTASVSS